MRRACLSSLRAWVCHALVACAAFGGIGVPGRAGEVASQKVESAGPALSAPADPPPLVEPGPRAPTDLATPAEPRPPVRLDAGSEAVRAGLLTPPAECACDYWIVSSRDCPQTPPASGPGCLSFFHRTGEKAMTQEAREAFLASVQPGVPVCFVVHGSYNWWRDVVNESRKINRWIRAGSPGTPVQVVFFTWPSDGNMPFIFPIDIAVLGRKASSHAVYLARLISELPPDQEVCLVGHSHGARTGVAALHLLGGGTLEGGQSMPPGFTVPRRLQAVLIAAAIDHDWLNPGERYSEALAVPERVLLLRNSRDATLAIYPARKLFSERALGRDGLGQQNRLRLGETAKKVEELDAAEFAGWHHAFADYHERAELATAIAPYVYFREDDPGLPAGTVPPATAAEPAPAKPQSVARPRLPPYRPQPAAPADAKPPARSGPPTIDVRRPPTRDGDLHPPDPDRPPQDGAPAAQDPGH